MHISIIFTPYKTSSSMFLLNTPIKNRVVVEKSTETLRLSPINETRMDMWFRTTLTY